MRIHVCTPFSLDKNLGEAYNEAFSRCPDDDWLCLIDYDVMFLTPNSIPIMYQYVMSYPHTGMFICRTNRINAYNNFQLAEGEPSENDSIRYWQQVAKEREKRVPETTNIVDVVSGFLMLVSKKTWSQNKIFANGRCLGVDNDFSRKILNSGKKILCMEGLVVWHSYRLNDIHDKSHL